MSTIIVEVRGGIAHVEGDIPPGVRLAIRDFDVEYESEAPYSEAVYDSPPDAPGLTQNQSRAARAEKALAMYCALTGNGYDAVQSVRDILADLMHYCEAYKVDFADELNIATNAYAAERDEQC